MTKRLAQGHIYIITNKINGKKYIGQTWYSIENRWSSHKSQKRRGCPLLHKAIVKYGSESFTIESVARFTNQKEADTLEIDHITKYNSDNPQIGYNLTKGGQNNKQPMPQEIRDQISQSLQGIKRSAETRAKMSNAQKRKIMSEDGQKSIDAEHARKRKLTIEQAEQIREYYKNGVLIPELSIKYNVSTTVVYFIIHNKTYIKNY